MCSRKVIKRLILAFGLWPMLVCPVWGYEPSVVPTMNGVPEDFAEHRAGKEVQASIRFGITNEGLYRISYTVLTNAGVSPALLVGDNMRLFCRTQEVAISLSSTGVWTSADYFLFVGVGYDGYYTPTNVYWLGFGAGGKRMSSRSATPFPGQVPLTSHRYTALHHEDYWFVDTYRWNDTSIDHWADRVPMMYSTENNISLKTDNVVAGSNATFTAVMMGRGIGAHLTRINVNGSLVGQFAYTGEVSAVIWTNFAGSSLVASNYIGFKQMASSDDTAWLERFSITYSRSNVQANQSLFFDGGPGSNTYRVTGFSSNANYTVLNCSDPADPVLLTGSQVTNMGSGVYAVLFGDDAAMTSRYAVCQAAGVRDVAVVQRAAFRGLAATSHQADYIVICPYEFRPEVYNLLKLRYLQGLSVAVAPLSDICNEFSYGIADAAAIKQFLGYAFHHWQSPPKYVLLAGSGSYNPRYHQEPHSPLLPDWIPVHLGPGNGAWVALDGWYAAVNGVDAVPDIAIGRLPVLSGLELAAVTEKIVAFEGVPANTFPRDGVLMVCDTNAPGYNFDKAADDLIAARVDTNFYYVDYVRGTNATPRTDIMGKINLGVFLANYFGHGLNDHWSDVPMLLTNDVLALVNNYYPVVSMMTCLNGAFQGSKSKCMASYFLTTPGRGASACVAASGLASLNAAEPFMDGFYRGVLGERRLRIGDCMMPAYETLATSLGMNVTELQFLGLLADPAMIVNP